MARNPTQHPDTVEIGVAVSRAISYGTQGSLTVIRGRSAPQVRLHLRSDAANSQADSAGRENRAGGRRHAGGMAGGLPRTRRRSIHAGRNLSGAPSASLCDRVRRPWTEPGCRQVRQQSGSGEGVWAG